MRRLLLVLLMAIAGCGAVLGFGVSAYAADGPVAPVAQQGAVTPQANPDDVELEIFRLTNIARQTGRYCGSTWYPAAPPVRWDGRIARAARLHSQDMGAQNYFAHTNLAGQSYGDRITAQGFSWMRASENINAGYADATASVNAWIASPVHCEDLMDAQVTFMGAGYAEAPTSTYKRYFTQDFARPAYWIPMQFSPDAPSIVGSSAGNGTATVAFAAPGWDGGSALLGYLYSLDDGKTWSVRSPQSLASPLVLTGLANGQTYTVRLKAYNSLLFQSGPSLASNAVSVTPQGVPGAPTITSASAADGSGTIDFRAGSDGGLPIRTYEYSLDGGSSWTARAPEAASSPLKLTGLANGTTYQVVLRAVNAKGAGAASNVVAMTVLSLPAAPVLSGIGPGDGVARVAFTQAHTGGLPLTGYEYSLDGGAWQAFSPGVTQSPATIANLDNGVPFAVRLRAVNARGPSAASGSLTVTPSAPAGSLFVPITPVRVWDSRTSSGGAGPLAVQETRAVRVADQLSSLGGAKDVVPAGAVAVAYNVTVPGSRTAGHLRVMPGDWSASPTSAINFEAGRTIANSSVVQVDGNRSIRVYNGASAPVDGVVDIVGYYVAAVNAAPEASRGRFTPVTPVRVFDSRQPGSSDIAAGDTRTVSVADQSPASGSAKDVVAPGASAVAYNVTVVSPAASGHLRIFPGDTDMPAASIINFGGGDTVANGSQVRVDADRQIRIFNSSGAAVRVLVDVVGYFSDAADGAEFVPGVPARVYDSRAAQPAPGPLPTGEAQADRTLSVADGRDSAGAPNWSGIVPANSGVVAVAYNLTVVRPAGGGHLRIYPADAQRPVASALNWTNAGTTRANASVVAVSSDRQLRIYNGSGSADALLDVLGYYRSPRG